MPNDEMPEWENPPEEEAPENLKRKWIEREHFARGTVACPSCKREVPQDTLTCLFCGEQVCRKVGVLSAILSRIKDFMRRF